MDVHLILLQLELVSCYNETYWLHRIDFFVFVLDNCTPCFQAIWYPCCYVIWSNWAPDDERSKLVDYSGMGKLVFVINPVRVIHILQQFHSIEFPSFSHQGYILNLIFCRVHIRSSYCHPDTRTTLSIRKMGRCTLHLRYTDLLLSENKSVPQSNLIQ